MSQFPQYDSLTINRTQSPLEGIFNPQSAYGEIRTSIFRSFTNVELDLLRRTSRTMNTHLLDPSPGTDPPVPRIQEELIDVCEEVDETPQRGPFCQNRRRNHHAIAPCQYRRFRHTRPSHPHGPGSRLVCGTCQGRHHFNSLRTVWRETWTGLAHYIRIVTESRLEVCGPCDARQRRRHPNGHDGCRCYRRYYRRRWLCILCDNAQIRSLRSYAVSTRVRVGEILYSRGKMRFGVQGGGRPRRIRPRCPCGTTRAPQHRAQTLPITWPVNTVNVRPTRFQVPRPPRVQQCSICCKYVVPATQLRQLSTRQSDRREGRQRDHQMLGGSGRATRANARGFQA